MKFHRDFSCLKAGLPHRLLTVILTVTPVIFYLSHAYAKISPGDVPIDSTISKSIGLITVTSVIMADTGEDYEKNESELSGISDDEAKKKAREHVAAGNRLFREGKQKEGCKEYREAIFLHEDAHAYFGMGICYSIEGRAGESVESMEKFLLLAPDHSRTADAERIIERNRKILAADAELKEKARRLIADADNLWNEEKHREACKKYRKALTLHEEALAYFGLGLCCTYEGRLEESIESMEKFLLLAPQHIRAPMAMQLIILHREKLAFADDVSAMALEDERPSDDVDEEIETAESPPEADEEPDDEKDKSKTWSGSINLGTGAGMVMFHPTEYVRSYGRSMSMSFGGSGRYRVSDNLSVNAGVGAAYHAVNPKDLSGRRFWLSDPTIGISHGRIYRDESFTGINFSGGLVASVGLSPSSRYWNRYGGISGSLSASRSFGKKFSLSWNMSLGTSFSKYTSPTGPKLSDDGLDMVLARADGSELLAGTHNLVAGNAQLGSFGNTLSASFRASKKLSLNISMGASQSYRYCPPIDHLSSEALDHHGERIVRQGDYCRSDGMTGSFGASYNAGSGYTISAGLNSAQPFFAYRGTSLTEESRRLRFPWWDPDLHMTSISIRAGKSF